MHQDTEYQIKSLCKELDFELQTKHDSYNVEQYFLNHKDKNVYCSYNEYVILGYLLGFKKGKGA